MNRAMDPWFARLRAALLAVLAVATVNALAPASLPAQTSTTQTIQVKPDPGTLVRYRGHIDETVYFTVTGSNKGTIWGTNIYTDDSPLAVAAVHAGLLKVGQRGVLAVKILDGADEYAGSERNGITSQDYGAHAGSYRIVFVRKAPTRPSFHTPAA